MFLLREVLLPASLLVCTWKTMPIVEWIVLRTVYAARARTERRQQ